MDEQRQDDQLEPIYNSSVPMEDVALMTYRERWTIETDSGRGSRRSMQAVRHYDDEEGNRSPRRKILNPNFYIPLKN